MKCKEYEMWDQRHNINEQNKVGHVEEYKEMLRESQYVTDVTVKHSKILITLNSNILSKWVELAAKKIKVFLISDFQ